MTKLVFETATLQDAIKKADKVAPAKGAAFDKASGIVLEVTPLATIPVVVRATNLDIYWMEWVDAIEAAGSPSTWRIPSRLIAGVVASLPIGSGRTVTFEETVNGSARQLVMTSGRTKARFNLIDHEYYPQWQAFDPDSLFPANDLGGRIAQVEWAAAKAEPPLSGVRFDGEFVVATDRYRLCRVPLAIPDLQEPVVVPSGIISGLIKQTGEVSIGVSGEQLLVMPDEHSQIRAVVYGQPYPNLGKPTATEYPQRVKFRKSELIEVMTRALNFAGSDRIPTMRIFVGRGEIGVMMGNVELGQLGDIVEVPGQADHPRCEYKFTPRNLMDALNNAPNDEVEVFYNPDNIRGIVKIDGGSGYLAWIMPRIDIGEKDA